MALLVGLQFGCVTKPAAGSSKSDSEQSSALSVRVLRVAGERAYRAGTQVDSYHVISTLNWPEAGLCAITAEGVPMAWDTLHCEPRPPRVSETSRFPVLGVYAARRPLTTTPNELILDPIVHAGQEVIIAGLDLDSLKNQDEFWQLPTLHKTATILERPITATLSQRELIWLAAPPGNYDGFIGGPVGVELPGQRFQVFAVILGFSQPTKQDMARIVLTAMPIGSIVERVEP